MAHPEPPKAFFSYLRHVDEHDGGRLSRLRERLQDEIRVQTGLKIDLFQDIRDLKWGDRWEQRILDAAAGSLFLIPVVTPGYFLSDPCRREYEAFRSLQEKHGIQGVILPIYYVETDELSDPAWREGNAWAEELAARQWVDWRTLRLEPWESPQPNRRVEQMALAFKAQLKMLGLLQPPPGGRKGGGAAVRGGGAKSAEKRADPVQASTSVGMTISSETTKGSTSLPTRREIIVDPDGRGHFRTISDAVKVAAADDILLVRPGTYRESVTIEKSITLLGDGPLEQVIVEADSGDAINFNAPFGRIVNLTIRRLMGGSDDFAVWIRAGRLELEGCDITSASLSCIGISGDADPTVRRNRIHDGKQAGVHVHGSGRGTIEDNDIFANAHAGVVISQEANPTVHRNRIHDGKSGGIFADEKGRGTIEDNDILANALTGIEVREGADLIARKNRIHKNSHGVWVYKSGRGTFEDNDLRDNARGPWNIAPECLPNVKRSGNIEK